jgi:hypothetical protein
MCALIFVPIRILSNLIKIYLNRKSIKFQKLLNISPVVWAESATAQLSLSSLLFLRGPLAGLALAHSRPTTFS